MKARVRSTLALYVLAPLALLLGTTSCELITGGGFKVEIDRGISPRSELQQLYVIVGDDQDLREPSRKKEYGVLLDQAALEDYESFCHFAPDEDGSWKQVFSTGQSEFVEYKVSGSAIKVKVKKSFVTAEGKQHRMLVIGFFGSNGFEQVSFNQTTLEGDGRVVVIGNNGLTATEPK